ncbi:MAG TPA: ADOP family duplicated permease [Thermoanaerobaculia bacterium]
MLRLLPHFVRQAFRSLARSPLTSAFAVLALACGIALTTAGFSLVHGILLRSLPFDGGERYRLLEAIQPDRSPRGLPVTPHEFLEWRRRQRAFESLVAVAPRSVNLSDDAGFPERRLGCFTTWEFFAGQPVPPALGRGFSAAEDAPGAAAVAVIGHDLWRRRFDGDPQVLGRSVRVDGESARVIGVMPPGFRFPLREEIWLPLRLAPGRGDALMVFGRLRDGVSPAAAAAEMSALAAALAAERPETQRGRDVVVRPYTQKFMNRPLRQALWALLGLMATALLIACANVAGLLTARAARRAPDLATRAALGAGRGELMAYVLTESALLALAGAAAGVALARLGVDVIAASMAWIPMPFWMAVTLDARALGAAAAATGLAAAAAGLYPAWHASRTDPAALVGAARSAAGRRRGGFLRALVVAEVAMAFLLLSVSGLFVRSLARLGRLDLGVDAGRLMTARLTLPASDYPDSAARGAFVTELVDRLAAAPGVAAAAAATRLPAAGYDNLVPYAVEAAAASTVAELPRAHRVATTPELFELFPIPVLQGRTLTAADRPEARPVAVVNRSLAAAAWPGEEAVGRRLRLEDGDAAAPWRTVVGVVADFWPGTLNDPGQAGVYVPLAQTGDFTMLVAASTRGDAEAPGAEAPGAETPGAEAPGGEALAELFRREARALDGGLPLYEVKTMSAVLEEERFLSRFFGRLVAALGAVSILFAAVGIYGVHALSVSRRTAEIGLRMALGAGRAGVLRQIVGESFPPLALGLAIGLLLAVPLTLLLGWALFQVEPWDPPTLAAAAALVSAVALVASYVPARRAARIEPVDALRHE